MGPGKRVKFDSIISLSRYRSVQLMMGLLFLYLILVGFEFPVVFRAGFGLESPGVDSKLPLISSTEDGEEPVLRSQDRNMKEYKMISGLHLDENTFQSVHKDDISELQRVARDAFVLGKKVFDDMQSGKLQNDVENRTLKKERENCPESMVLSGKDFLKKRKLMVIPCGLSLGSIITVVGRPRRAHLEKMPGKRVGEKTMVSQFVMELLGLRAVDGEEPPKILHFNPRLKGDWSERPVIVHNSCYRMQCGSAQRCVGWRSSADQETVDGQVKCEKWMRDNDSGNETSKATWWANRLIGRIKTDAFDWPYPFVETKLFVLALSAGLEGYHINVDGRHVSSFPYRPGFTLEDATGLFLDGDVDIHSIFAASLPMSHPSTAHQRHMEFSPEWKAPRVNSSGPVDLFIGILSAGNHFAERMAIRKSWMQYESVRYSNVVARFFVAMHARNEVNLNLKKEAEFFGDIVLVPFMDNYDLVVLKTVAICEYGIRTVAAKYIMKCDDDTFVRVDAVLKQIKQLRRGRSFYIGNINYYHRPLRHGKWAVTHEEWPEEVYPAYANGPGYAVSSDIAQFVVSEFEKHKLRLFKMEDVSMGMWVEQFTSIKTVDYVHTFGFCQFGCVEGYYTAHYQSPRQMLCLWDKLQLYGKPHCCNVS